MNLFYQPLIPEGVLHLDAEESKHCARVLRKNKGDTILITDGKGFFYNAIITHPDAHQCSFLLAEKIPEIPKKFSIHVAISPTKNADRLEWFVEKAVEVGIDEISFIVCKNTERPFIKQDRLEKIAVSAMKQSLKATLPRLTGLHKFTDSLKKNHNYVSGFIAFVDSSNPNHLKDIAKPYTSYRVLVGPEGDFTTDELTLALENGFQKVSLGASRLRTETAGLVACHILNLINT